MRIDERFLQHRFKATSHAAVVGALVAAGWHFWEFVVHDVFRWDLASVLIAMLVTKLGAVLYYRLRE
jgi:hypothetical protein